VARIIYVEDDDLMGAVVKDILTTAGHLIGVVPHGGLGADTVAFKKPDLALVDLTLPGISGIEVIKHLRRSSGTHLMPILVLTGDRRPSASEEAMGAGANDVMTKPFSPEDLVARVAQVLSENPFSARSDSARSTAASSS